MLNNIANNLLGTSAQPYTQQLGAVATPISGNMSGEPTQPFKELISQNSETILSNKEVLDIPAEELSNIQSLLGAFGSQQIAIEEQTKQLSQYFEQQGTGINFLQEELRNANLISDDLSQEDLLGLMITDGNFRQDAQKLIEENADLSAVYGSVIANLNIVADELQKSTDATISQLHSLINVDGSKVKAANDSQKEISTLTNADDLSLDAQELESMIATSKREQSKKDSDLFKTTEAKILTETQANLGDISEKNASNSGKLTLENGVAFNSATNGSSNNGYINQNATSTSGQTNFKNYQLTENVKVVQVTKSDKGLELHLEPAHLGKIQIKVEYIGNDSKANFSIIADNKDSLDIMQRESRSLEKILTDNGFKSDSSSLNFSLNNQEKNSWQQFAQDRRNQENMLFNIDDLTSEDTISNQYELGRDYGSLSLSGGYINGMINILV